MPNAGIEQNKLGWNKFWRKIPLHNKQWLIYVMKNSFPINQNLCQNWKKNKIFFDFFWHFFYQSDSSFVLGCLRTSDREVCPGIFAAALIPGKMDTRQGNCFGPGQRDNGMSYPALSHPYWYHSSHSFWFLEPLQGGKKYISQKYKGKCSLFKIDGNTLCSGKAK